MHAGRLTRRLLVGSGLAAGALSLAAGVAGAASNPPAKKAPAAVVGTSSTTSSSTTSSTTSPSTTSTTAKPKPKPTTSTTAAPTTSTTARKATTTTTAPSTTTTTSKAPSATTTTAPAPAEVLKPAVLARGPVILSAPSSTGSDATPTWSVYDPDGDPLTCSLSFGGSVVTGPAPCGPTATFNLSGRSYGTYTFVVTDGTATATGTYTFSPATPTITSAPSSPGSDATPTWSFTLPAGTTGRCTLSLAGSVIAGPSACSGSQTYPITRDGVYTFTVVAVGDGLTSAPATSTYTADVSGPATPTITSGPGSLSGDDTPTWTYTVGANTASTTCTLSSGGTVIETRTNCTSPASFDLTALPDGSYTFRVVAYDDAGNASTPASSAFTLQRAAFAPTPAITSSPTSPGTDTTPTWAFTTPAGTTTWCSLIRNGNVVAGPVACSGTHTFTLTADGTYTFEVYAVDTVTGARGLAATSTYTLDTTPPAAPVFTSTPGAGGNDRTPTWTFTMPTGAVALECTLTRNGTVVAGPTNCSGGSYEANINRFGEGTYTLTVVAIDAVGNRSAPATNTYVFDRTAPTAPVITGGPTGTVSTSTVTWTFTYPAGTTATCTLTGPGTDIRGPCTGTASYDLTNRPDGTYTFSVFVTDSAGNRSATVSTTVTIDRTAPDAPVITGGPSGTSTDTTPEWRFTEPRNTTTICTVYSGSTIVIGPVSCGSPAAFDLSGLPNGTYTFSVVAVDRAGNTSAPATRTYTLQRAGTGPTPPPPGPGPNPPGRPGPTPPPPGPAPVPPPPAPARPVAGPVAPTGPGLAPAVPAPSTPAPARPPLPRLGRPGVPGVPGVGPGSLTPLPAPTPSPAPGNIVEQAGRVALEATEGAAFPLLLLILLVLFLIIQNRIDNRDPKLAQAPVHAGDDLEFGPPPSRRGMP